LPLAILNQSKGFQFALIGLAGLGLLAATLIWVSRDRSTSVQEGTPVPPAATLRSDAQPAPTEAPPRPTPPAANNPAFPALTPPSPETLANLPHHPEGLQLGSPSIPPEDEPRLVWNLFDVYRQAFQSFPTGASNAHFIHAIQGANPGRQPIFPLEHTRLDPEGNLLDAWGTPFHFHPISRHALEIRSAGPDRELFTEDDIVYP
jgi:hypothetical protein